MKSLPPYFLIYFIIFLLNTSCSQKSKDSITTHQESVLAAQSRMKQRQELIGQVENMMNEKAKARLAENKAFLLKGNISSSCACGSGEEHTHFPSRLLSPTQLSTRQGSPIGPIVLLSQEFTVSPNQEILFQLKIVNLQQKMYSGTLQITAIQPEGTPFEIPLLPQFKKNSSPIFKETPPTRIVREKIKIFHLHPAYEMQISLKFHPGNYLYYDWAQGLETLRQKQYKVEFVQWVEEDPALVPHEESSAHSHQHSK